MLEWPAGKNHVENVPTACAIAAPWARFRMLRPCTCAREFPPFSGAETGLLRHTMDSLKGRSFVTIQSPVSLRTSAHTGVAIPRLFGPSLELIESENKGYWIVTRSIQNYNKYSANWHGFPYLTEELFYYFANCAVMRFKLREVYICGSCMRPINCLIDYKRGRRYWGRE